MLKSLFVVIDSEEIFEKEEVQESAEEDPRKILIYSARQLIDVTRWLGVIGGVKWEWEAKEILMERQWK